MQDIVNLVRRAGRALLLSRLLEATAATGMVMGCVLLIAALFSKAVPALAFDWWWMLLAGVVATLGIAGWSAVRGTRDPLAVAIEVDARLGLKDRFSVAWQMRRRDDPFAIAAIEDAAEVARAPETRTRLRRSFRPAAPRGWWASILLVAAFVGVWTVVPQGDLFAEDEPASEDVALVETRRQIEAEMESLAAILDDESLANTDLQDALDAMMAEDPETPEPEDMTPADMRRDAIRQVASLQEKLDELLEGDEARLEERLQDALADLDARGLEDEDSRELAEALADGDFEAAREAFERMRDRLEGEEGDSPENQAMAGDLEKLAREIERLASDQKAMEEMLRQAGMDPDLAANKEALEQAMRQADQLNESQRQAIQEMMKSQGQASQSLKDLAKAMQQASQCNNPSAGQDGQKSPGQSGSEQLGELERMQQMLQQARGAQQQCQNACQKMGSGLSEWASSLPSSNGSASGQGSETGPGMGGPGRGAGGEAPKAPTPTRTVDQRETVENRGGDVIAREFIEGEIVTGESRAKLREISERIGKGDEQGVAGSTVPPHLRDVHRHYFGKVKKRLDAATKGGETASPSEKNADPSAPSSTPE